MKGSEFVFFFIQVVTEQISRDSKHGTDVLSSFLQDTPSSPSLDPSGPISACEKFVSGVIVNLRDRFVSKGDGQVISAMCSLFHPSLIASSVSPSIRKL